MKLDKWGPKLLNSSIRGIRILTSTLIGHLVEVKKVVLKNKYIVGFK